MNPAALWDRYRRHLCRCDSVGVTLDISRMTFPDDFFSRMAGPMGAAYAAMDELEKGAIANPDEKRMVGHYWLRKPELAPQPAIAKEIRDTVERIKRFAGAVHGGKVKPSHAERFTQVLVIGIGGSALGPQFVADALGEPTGDRADKMAVSFLDNTDPDGIDRELRKSGPRLAATLSIVISKSGGTPETRNGMILAKRGYESMGLAFGRHAVAVTGAGSQLDKLAESEGWLDRFPMWDWVGGRTSELAAVGLIPAALQGLDIGGMLSGAAAMDEVTRRHDTPRNPAALLALMWHHATGGRGEKDMVVLPYSDRLLLFSRYLQQLVMESLGKADDLKGKRVEQGIAVYGNKGSTDQHAYVQQLREGVNNFFAVFVRVLGDGGGASGALEVEPSVTAGDYLDGFWQGTRRALYENGRQSMTITIPRVDAFHVGALIALFERAVGLYASLVGINAYHQPGVEAGKRAAASVLEVQNGVLDHLAEAKEGLDAAGLAAAMGRGDEVETVYHILCHLEANGRASRVGGDGADARFKVR